MPAAVAILSATFCFLCTMAAFAGENPLLGTWKLKSFVREVAATGERYNERGEHPNGYLSYAADGRMYAIITWDNRVNPRDVVPTAEERVKLYGTIVCGDLYGGRGEGDSPRRYLMESSLDGNRPNPIL
jgi:hypothetical protein